MLGNLKTSIWGQFGASLDYLQENINACPDDLWTAELWQSSGTPVEMAQYWYVVYHTIFWIDVYLFGTEDNFLPPDPFTLIEQTQVGPIPEEIYTKQQLLDYLNSVRQTCQKTINDLTEATLNQQCEFGWGSCSFMELLIYNLRHVHGHASQLNMLLGQHIGVQPSYVTRSRT